VTAAPHDPAVTLHGFRWSVYVRIARMALAERGVAHDLIEVNPFEAAAEPPNPHPMNRIPVLDHGGFRLYETRAILAYVDRAFPGPPLVPADPRAAARVAQVQGIADSYAYVPLVREVYEAAVFAPATGAPRDAARITAGLEAARPVLAMLDAIAAEGLALAPGQITLADIHLAPMIAAFAGAPEGAQALARHPALQAWWERIRSRDSLTRFDPGLPSPAAG